MKIKNIKIADLKPAPYNPRLSTPTQEENLRTSLEKFGVVEPIIYNEQTGHIVGGHFRVRELEKLGHMDVPAVIVNLSLEDEKELNIRLNANTGEWDFDKLNEEFNAIDLETWGMELPEFEEEEEKGGTGDSQVDETFKIVLEFTEDEYRAVKDGLKKIAKTPEQAVWVLLFDGQD